MVSKKTRSIMVHGVKDQTYKDTDIFLTRVHESWTRFVTIKSVGLWTYSLKNQTGGVYYLVFVSKIISSIPQTYLEIFTNYLNMYYHQTLRGQQLLLSWRFLSSILRHEFKVEWTKYYNTFLWCYHRSCSFNICFK